MVQVVAEAEGGHEIGQEVGSVRREERGGAGDLTGLGVLLCIPPLPGC